MSEQTAIEWCDATLNPWEGCTKISPGCANCYAATRNHRFGNDNWGKGKPRRRVVGFEKAALALNRKAEREERQIAVFPSLCDWLDEEVPVAWLARFLTLIHNTPHITWLVLTKRPENWPERLRKVIAGGGDRTLAISWFNGEPPANVWVGTSVEDQARADERIPELLKIPAAGRFLSVEPLLGPVNLGYRGAGGLAFDGGLQRTNDAQVDWVIVGGESGPKARPCNVDWIRDIVRQCKAATVPCFVKQLGSRPCCDLSDVIPEASPEEIQDDPMAAAQWDIHRHQCSMHLRHPKGGDPAEWPEDLRVREFPKGLSK